MKLNITTTLQFEYSDFFILSDVSPFDKSIEILRLVSQSKMYTILNKTCFGEIKSYCSGSYLSDCEYTQIGALLIFSELQKW